MKRNSIFLSLAIIALSLVSCNFKIHVHTFEEAWSFNSEYHYHQATCEHTSMISNKEAHDFSLISTIEPTFESEGSSFYKCNVCGYQKEETIEKLKHSYANEYSFDDYTHWFRCLDEGYEDLRIKEENHDDKDEVIITQSTETEVGLAQYTCSICHHTYLKDLLIKTSIVSSPKPNEQDIYVGQTLKTVPLIGGKGTVDGSFIWTNEDEVIDSARYYSVTFIPKENEKYASVNTSIYIDPIQLTVNVVVGENGSANKVGLVNVDYNSTLNLVFTPNSGYSVEKIILDGVEQTSSPTFSISQITTNHEISVSFIESGEVQSPFSINYMSGTTNAYEIKGSTIYFNEINEETVYQIEGEFNGNIVIDVKNDFKFDLEMTGFTLTSTDINPITILSGDEITLKAKSGTKNYINDNRELIDSTDTSLYSAAIYSLVDLQLSGKGELNVTSLNNNGIHTKDDLQVKNLTLNVTCNDNCLKGNDSVEITSASTNLISKKGDGIKTNNSDISTSTSKQRGNISIVGGNHNIYAACDGIDASYNALIDDETTNLNIFTDKYSSYSEDVTTTSEEIYYIRYSSKSYNFSIKYFNDETDYKWENATYFTSSQGGRSTYYYYKINKLTSYSKMIVYMYSSSQSMGQDTSYYAATSTLTLNNNYNTIALSYRQNVLSASFTTYTTSQGGMGGMGGMNDGNSDKGEYSTKGIKAQNEIIIENGNINIKSYDDAIHTNNTAILENGNTSLGNVIINNGNLTLYSNDDGIHGDGSVTINNGTIDIQNAYEGVEGSFVTFNGGYTYITSLDDGVNSTVTSGTGITLNNGYLFINANGDGIDSNSTTQYEAISFSGTNVIVICSSNNNSSIDSERGYKYSKGYVLGISKSGGMSSESSNCNNLSSIGKTSTLSLTANNYLTVSVSSKTVFSFVIPVTLSSYLVFLGSTSPTITQASSSTLTYNTHNVYWA